MGSAFFRHIYDEAKRGFPKVTEDRFAGLRFLRLFGLMLWQLEVADIGGLWPFNALRFLCAHCCLLFAHPWPYLPHYPTSLGVVLVLPGLG